MRFFVGILLCVFQLNCTFSNHKKLIKKNIHQIPSITITPYNDGKRISYTFKSDIPIKFKLVKTYNNYLMFLNNKFKIGLDKLQNSIVKTVFEPGKFTNLRFIPRIPEAEYYGHTVQISDKSFKLSANPSVRLSVSFAEKGRRQGCAHTPRLPLLPPIAADR